MREAAFDIEQSIFTNESNDDNHVFVAGLARSGTTILLNALHKSDEFASLSYADMPFVLAPNLWSMLSSNKNHIVPIDRAHGDGIKVSTDSPEAFEEVFWKTFDESNAETKEKFKTYISFVLKRYKKDRYLSKNNQNIRRLGLINNILPNSKILIPFRDPLQHTFSLITQHKRFIAKSNKDVFISRYMNLIGHTEFGKEYECVYSDNLEFQDDLHINHWLEQWYEVYSYCLKFYLEETKLHFICYEFLCEREETWKNVLKLLDLNNTYHFNFLKSEKEINLEVDTKILSKCKMLYDDLALISV